MYLPLFVGVHCALRFLLYLSVVPTPISFALLDNSFVIVRLSLSEREAVESACL